MLTRPQVLAHLRALGFTTQPSSSSTTDNTSLIYAGLLVQLLDAPRVVAYSATGEVVYLAVSSADQLEEQLTELLGYQRPPVG